MRRSPLAKTHSKFALPVPPRQLLGGGLLGLGGLLLVLLVLVLPVWTRLECDRSITELVSCRLRGANLIGIAWRNQKVMPMVGAETNLQSAQSGYRYRTSIFTYNDEIPLAPFSVDRLQANRTKETIMDFVGDKTAQQLRVSYRVPWTLFGTAIAFALVLSGIGRLLLWL